VVTTRINGELISLGNPISDGSLVVYYHQLLVHPDQHGKGVGRKIVEAMQRRMPKIWTYPAFVCTNSLAPG
jgi:GNAT superfamily N-acetyltransferase